jgi:hypothetical protein
MCLLYTFINFPFSLLFFTESEDEEDEFFDCDENMSSNATENVGKMNKPVGRLRKCGRLRLLKTGEVMYIPITQVQRFSFLFDK